MSCQPCEYAAAHGWWGPDHRGTHCRGCHRSWTSKAQSHCTDCHRHFGSHEAGDAHRVGDECREPKGFPVYETDRGPVIGGKDPSELSQRFSAPGDGARTGESAVR